MNGKAGVPGEERIAAIVIGQKLSQLKRLTFLIERVKKEVKILFGKTKYQNVATMKGVNVILAARIISEARGIERFSSINKFIAYAGLAPKERSSGMSKRHKKSKQGNRKLNSTFYLLALNQLRWNNKAKEYFQKKISEGKSKKHGLRCLAKRSACIVYGMLRSGKPYRA